MCGRSGPPPGRPGDKRPPTSSRISQLLLVVRHVDDTRTARDVERSPSSNVDTSWIGTIFNPCGASVRTTCGTPRAVEGTGSCRPGSSARLACPKPPRRPADPCAGRAPVCASLREPRVVGVRVGQQYGVQILQLNGRSTQPQARTRPNRRARPYRSASTCRRPRPGRVDDALRQTVDALGDLARPSRSGRWKEAARRSKCRPSSDRVGGFGDGGGDGVTDRVHRLGQLLFVFEASRPRPTRRDEASSNSSFIACFNSLLRVVRSQGSRGSSRLLVAIGHSASPSTRTCP